MPRFLPVVTIILALAGAACSQGGTGLNLGIGAPAALPTPTTVPLTGEAKKEIILVKAVRPALESLSAAVKKGDQIAKRMAILFSDIRSFTTIVENKTPEENFAFINRYMEHMEPAVLESGGFIDSFIGDAIMALFEGGLHGGARGGIACPDFELRDCLLQKHLGTVNDGAALLFRSLQEECFVRVVDHIEDNVRGNHIVEE